MVLSSLFILLFIELCKNANGNPFTIESLEAVENHNGSEQRSFRQPSNIWNSISQITEGRVFKLASPHTEARRNLENAITKKSLGVKIIPFLSDISPNSVMISWEVEHNNPNLYKKFGFKVSFRSFGSSVEREVIFAIEGDGLDENMNTYKITGLKESTGYVFCFRVMSHEEVAEAFQSNYALRANENLQYSDEIKETEDYTENLIESSEATSKSTTKEVFKLTEIVNVTGNLYSSTTEQIESTTIPQINFDSFMKKINDLEDILRSNNSQDPTNLTTPSSLVTVPPTVNFPLVTNPKVKEQESKPKGTYAYSSTGELIYMPASSWTPSFQRKKRNLKNYSYSASSDSESARCIEVFTTQSSTLKILNPYILMIVALIIIAIIIFLILIYCVKKLLCGGTATKIIKKLCFGKPKMCTTAIETIEDPTSSSSSRESSAEEKDRSLDCEVEQKEHLQCHCSTSLPSYQEILVRHDLKEKLKGTLRLGKQKSLDSSFHPGYALPPSSTTEVYGYDIPKLSNKGSLVNTPDSMDINDGYGFNDNEIYNWNCLTPQKSSSASKSFLKEDKHSAPPLALPKKQNAGVQTNNPERYEIQSVDENDQTYDSLSIRSTGSSRKSSLGDITISGGTLIEVPDGYVVPDRSKGLRLIVTGTPVYL